MSLISRSVQSAPEIHRDEVYSFPVDVFSFAIVCWEIFTRKLPYPDLHQPWDVKNAVVEGVRPPIPPDTPELYAQLIRNCWQDEPSKRPTFAAIAETLSASVEDS